MRERNVTTEGKVKTRMKGNELFGAKCFKAKVDSRRASNKDRE